MLYNIIQVGEAEEVHHAVQHEGCNPCTLACTVAPIMCFYVTMSCTYKVWLLTLNVDSSDIQSHSVDNSISYLNLSLDPDIHVPQLLTWKAKFGLTEVEKQILQDGKWLNSSIIAADCKLLKMFFPEQNGLEDTCTLTYKQCNPESFVQILYVNGNHWLCVSNKLTHNQSVEMFDSLHTVPVEDGEIVFQVVGILAPTSYSFEIDLVNMQLQYRASDCGLYAIAYAFDLCAGKDPFEAT